MNMVIYQMDVKTAFLNGIREKRFMLANRTGLWIQITQSLDRLQKALYWLKQAPRAWYDMLSSFLISQDFSKGSVDPTLFIRKEGKELLLIFQNPRGIFINQSKYALESLKKYGFDSCDLVDTPMVEKSKLDEDKEGTAIDPSHYHDVDMQFQEHSRSTSGSMQFLGDRLVSWLSKRQKSAAISSTEAEYIAMSGCCAQILWMRSQLTDYGLGFNKIPIEKNEFLINKLGMRALTAGDSNIAMKLMDSGGQKSKGKSQLDTGKANSSDKDPSGRVKTSSNASYWSSPSSEDRG
ncbi:copia protein [Tanacetum coccineum]